MAVRKAFSVAALQMTSGDEISANGATARGLCERAVRAGAEVVVLPENFMFLGAERAKIGRVGEIHTAAESFLRETSRALGVWLIGGGYASPCGEAGRVFNRLSVVNPDGVMVASYDKLHLFEVDIAGGPRVREADTVKAGDRLVVAELGELGRVGCSICYDVRFPELYRGLIDAGADWFVCPAAFTAETGKAHWELLLRARAVENVTYMVAAAQTGVHRFAREGDEGGQTGIRATHGHAMVVDPWGCVVADAGDEPGFALATVDGERIERARAKMPSLTNRRGWIG